MPFQRSLTEQAVIRLAWIWTLVLFLSGCSRNQLRVLSITNPNYPPEAMLKRIQGEAKIDISIGPDGRVLVARGTGTDSLLVAVAEENARTWVFGSFHGDRQFPIRHQIIYKFTLEGEAKYVGVKPKITTDLPSKVEIVANPMISDGPSLIPRKPADSVKGGWPGN